MNSPITHCPFFLEPVVRSAFRFSLRQVEPLRIPQFIIRMACKYVKFIVHLHTRSFRKKSATNYIKLPYMNQTIYCHILQNSVTMTEDIWKIKRKVSTVGVRNDFGICRYCSDDNQHHRHDNQYPAGRKKDIKKATALTKVRLLF